jgi:hypothetical protein
MYVLNVFIGTWSVGFEFVKSASEATGKAWGSMLSMTGGKMTLVAVVAKSGSETEATVSRRRHKIRLSLNRFRGRRWARKVDVGLPLG